MHVAARGAPVVRDSSPKKSPVSNVGHTESFESAGRVRNVLVPLSYPFAPLRQLVGLAVTSGTSPLRSSCAFRAAAALLNVHRTGPGGKEVNLGGTLSLLFERGAGVARHLLGLCPDAAKSPVLTDVEGTVCTTGLCDGPAAAVRAVLHVSPAEGKAWMSESGLVGVLSDCLSSENSLSELSPRGLVSVLECLSVAAGPDVVGPALLLRDGAGPAVRADHARAPLVDGSQRGGAYDEGVPRVEIQLDDVLRGLLARGKHLPGLLLDLGARAELQEALGEKRGRLQVLELRKGEHGLPQGQHHVARLQIEVREVRRQLGRAGGVVLARLLGLHHAHRGAVLRRDGQDLLRVVRLLARGDHERQEAEHDRPEARRGLAELPARGRLVGRLEGGPQLLQGGGGGGAQALRGLGLRLVLALERDRLHGQARGGRDVRPARAGEVH